MDPQNNKKQFYDRVQRLLEDDWKSVPRRRHTDYSQRGRRAGDVPSAKQAVKKWIRKKGDEYAVAKNKNKPMSAGARIVGAGLRARSATARALSTKPGKAAKWAASKTAGVVKSAKKAASRILRKRNLLNRIR